MMTTTTLQLQSPILAMAMARWILILVQATVLAHVGEKIERRFMILWVISGRRRLPSRQGGGGNHGQVASVTIIDLAGCVLCVVCCYDCVGQHCVFDVNDACQR